MSLDWYHRDNEAVRELPLYKEWHEVIVFATMAVDLGKIDEKTWPEWQWRMEFMKQCGLRIASRWVEGHGRIALWPSKETMQLFFGLSTNVTTITRKQWIKKIVQQMENQTNRELREAARLEAEKAKEPAPESTSE